MLALSILGLGACTTSEDAGADGVTATELLTCDLIAGPSCWTRALAEVKACAPGDQIGILSTDAKSCAVGAKIATFTGEVTALTNDSSFSIDLPGCAEIVVDSPARMHALRTAAGEASWTIGDTISLQCPDGVRYTTDSLSALRCPGFVKATSRLWTSSASSFGFTLVGTQENVPVLHCER
jgi:hypothetical protein